MAATLSVRDFFARFPDDDACLAHVMEVRYGLQHACRKCTKEATFHRITGRKAFACAQCGDHVYPCADTIFQDSRTSMQLWFYAIFLFVTTRHGVSARELQRSLGVTLKAAWRMGHKIRELTGRADMKMMLDGHVEIDETYVGGKAGRANAFKNKTIVMGLKKRGGRLHTEVIPNLTIKVLQEVVTRQVQEGTTISTDEWVGYGHHRVAGGPGIDRKRLIGSGLEKNIGRSQHPRLGRREGDNNASAGLMAMTLIVGARRHDNDPTPFRVFWMNASHIKIAN
jgi:transposase